MNNQRIVVSLNLKRTIKIMKLTILMLVACLSQIAAATYAQTTKLSISANNETLENVLKQIEKQSEFLFFYNLEEVNKNERISIMKNDASIQEVLSAIADKTGLKYTIKDRHIVLTVKGTPVSAVVTQQKRIVTGVVSDTFGPVAGANVIQKGTTNGVTTDIDGNFSIEVPENAILQVSYIGFYTTEVKVENQNNINIVLKEDTQKLDEVIVVGYTATTKRALISSVSSVNAEELVSTPVANITQSLAGRSPGLIVQGAGGGINRNSTISIRGGETPLVVIDGVIRDYNDFTSLSPNDIESMSLLKDASATAVYGSRAGNGIIQVTTKRGKSGKASVGYDFTMSFSQPNIWPEQLNSWQRAEYANISRLNDGMEEAYSPDAIQKMKDGSDPLSYGNTDWRNLVLRNWAPMSKHTVSLTGGTEFNTYYASIGYVDQESLYRTNSHNMQRTNFRLSNTSNIKSIGLSVTANIDGYVEKERQPYTSSAGSAGSIFSHIQTQSPLTPGVNKNGLPYNVSCNPVSETSWGGGYKKDRKKQANGNLEFKWALPWVEGLTLKAAGNYRYYIETSKQWRKDAAKYDWDSDVPRYDDFPRLFHSTKTNYQYTMQYFGEYSRNFGKHFLNVLGGYEYSYGFTDYYWEQRENFNFAIDQLPVGSTDRQTNSGEEYETGRAGWVGQLKYNYDNRYFIEGSLRYDGSDNLPKGSRWGAFYSGSLGWSVIDEAFMESIKEKNIFTTLKIRTSYGQVGLDNWGKQGDTFYVDRYSYLNSYKYDGYAYVINGNYVPGFTEGSLPSPDLTWFKSEQVDLGFDFSSLRDRLYGSFDYFYYKTTGFLYAPKGKDIGYTAPLGQALPKVSTRGEHRREGFDFQLGWRDNFHDFTYNVALNFTKFDQLWAYDPSEAESSYMNPYQRTSQQTGYYKVLHHNLGYYISVEDVYNSVKPLGSTGLTAGDIKYLDYNGDGKIDNADQQRLGKSSFPRANYGININLGYKGFFLDMLFQGATRFDMYLGTSTQMGGGGTSFMPVIYDYQTDYWTPSNTTAMYPRLSSNPGLYGRNNYLESDFWLINGAYLRMKEIRFGYDFKKSIAKNLTWLSKAIISVSGQNIFTISDATKYGLDPENASTDNFAYPNERVFAVNLNIGF